MNTRILQLQAQNIKRLTAVEITPDGNMVVIGGGNGQGKSSVLDAITMALGGKNTFGPRPVREGADKGKIVIELEDLVITRTITANGGGTLTVKDRRNATLSSPQTVLDRLYSHLSFDPLAFMREKPAAQRDMLQALVGLDFSQLNADRQRLFSERTAVNAQAKTALAQLEAMPHHQGAPEVEVSVSELLDELRRLESRNRQAEEEREKVRDRLHELENLMERVEIQDVFAPVRAQVGRALRFSRDALNGLPLPEIEDPGPLRYRLTNAEALNRQVRENAARASRQEEWQALTDRSQALTAAIEAIDRQKVEAMTAAAFPVPGLGFDEQGVTFNGLPFVNCSSAERLRISVAMGLALNPELRVLLIRDGSLLDEQSLRMIADMAEAHQAQLWIERVGTGEECSVIIEDGEVKPHA